MKLVHWPLMGCYIWYSKEGTGQGLSPSRPFLAAVPNVGLTAHYGYVSQRVVFKTAFMVWKCVHGVAPAYLSDLCVPATASAISGRQHLRSAATGTLLVPRAHSATGRRSFAVNGLATWNRLPPALRSPDLSESAFKRALKTHLFSTGRRH